MKRLFIYPIIMSILVCFACATFGVAKNSSTMLPKSAKGKAVLFIQSAQGGKITTNGPGKYILTLTGLNTTVRYFEDRPFRGVGTISTEEYMKAWNTGEESFAKDNPNVAMFGNLDVIDTKNREHLGIFVLSNPQYNKAQNSMTYDVRPLTVDGFDLSGGQYRDIHIVIDAAMFGSFWGGG